MKVSTDFKSYFWVVCAFVVLPCLVLYIISSSHITSIFPQSPWAYAMQYDTESQYVVIDPKPHDCEFFKAPIGSKYCHFNRKVTTRIDNESLVRKTFVYVSWDKVPE